MKKLEDTNPFYAQILSEHGRNEYGEFNGSEALTAAAHRDQGYRVTVHELASEIMRLVEKDVSIGVIPWDVPDWPTMHSFCDANEYLLEVVGLDMSQEGSDLANAITDELNRRLSGSSDGNPAAYPGEEPFDTWFAERYSAVQKARKALNWPYRREWI